MKAYKNYADVRLGGLCAYCDALPSTKDHIPSKIFLSEPYPDNLQTVPACEKCNKGYSKDEQFLAYFIEYLKMLDASDQESAMINIQARYKNWSSLENRVLNYLRINDDGHPSIELEITRIKNIIQKFAICHILYETGTKVYSPPSHLTFSFLQQMTTEALYAFNNPIEDVILPEIGSRLFQRVICEGNSWTTVQEGNYRYYVNAGSSVLVRFVIKEILYCEAIWNDL